MYKILGVDIMKIYHYNANTKEYMGEGKADLSPLDLLLGQEVWLIPANATELKPPPHISKKDVVYINNEWHYKEG